MQRLITTLIAVSFALNLALAAFLVAGRLTPAASAARAPAARTPRAARPPEINAEVWPKLQTDELPTLVERLREAGFPSAVVRAIVATELIESFAARRRALDPNAESRPFWKDYTSDPRVLLAQSQLGREQEKALRDLLGDDPADSDPYSQALQRRQLTGLSPEKAADVKRIQREFNERMNDVYATMRGQQLPDDRAKIAALEKEQRVAIAAALGPAEFEAFDLRNGPTSTNLRYQMALFNPTEAEFLAIYRLQRPLDEQYREMNYISGTPTPAQQQQMQQRSEAYKLLNEQIKAVLGPERAAEFERMRDYEFQRTTKLLERLELPPARANDIWAIQKEFEKRLETLQSDGALSADAKREQLVALGVEAKTKVTAALGERGYTAYQRNGGYWLQQLEPPRPPPKK